MSANVSNIFGLFMTHFFENSRINETSENHASFDNPYLISITAMSCESIMESDCSNIDLEIVHKIVHKIVPKIVPKRTSFQ